MKKSIKKIVVVGGGFAGINFINRLANDERFEVTLVDLNNYHFFPPLLYQVGMAFIEPSSISYPFRRLFQQKKNLRFHLGSLVKVDPVANSIETDTGTLPYDYLILALGTESNYFGMENVKKNAWPLKTINDATTLRNNLLLNLEKVVRSSDAERQKIMSVVIAGGGPTGVEVAGMMAEMSLHIGPREYPEIANVRRPIYLVEAASALLGPMRKKSQDEAMKVLQKLGVEIKLNTAVKDYIDGKVLLSNGESIPTNVLIWTSGVIGKSVPGLPAESIGKGKRILVDEFNKVKSTSNVFAIGDISLQTSDKNFPNGHPQLAQVAIQHGKLLAENIKRESENRPMKSFAYNDKGSMAIIAKYKAVGDLPNTTVRGFIAWLIWLFIHLIPIVSFRNKTKLVFSWLWSFITNDPTLRLIIRPRTEGQP